MAQNSNEHSIEKLTERFQTLHQQKIEANAHLQNAQKQMSELKAQALEEFGTDDLDELKQKLKDMELENERNRFEYQQKLDEIERNLESVKEQYKQSSNG